MPSFHFHADLEDPQALAAAVAAATGASDVRLLAGWNGCDRESGQPLAAEKPGTVNVEWLRRKGRFSLDVQVFGPDLEAAGSQARFARRIARALGRAVLFSDCSPFGFSYFSAEPDGAIWAQLLVIGDDDVMDLDALDHPDPGHRLPRCVYGPDEALPPRPAGAPTDWTRGDRTCETAGPGPCRVFYTAGCPKRRALGDSGIR